MKRLEFFKKDAEGNSIPPSPDWSDVAGLDYRNPQLRLSMTDMLNYWLKAFDLDYAWPFEKRAIARFGERGALAASALVFTIDDAPMLYNGMEVGDTTESGAPALFEMLPVFWQISERRAKFLPFYKQLIATRLATQLCSRAKPGGLGTVHPIAF